MNKICLITGASGDIGKTISEIFAKNNYNLILCYNKNRVSCEQLKDYLVKKYNIDAITIKVDISQEKEVEEMVKVSLNKFNHIDVLINNAAVELSSDISCKTKETFSNVLDVNLIGTFLVIKHVSVEMLKNKTGKIVNISSNNGINKYDPMTLEYDVSKAAINHMTKTLAKYYAPYININAVAPGWVRTNKNIELDKILDNKFISSESDKILLKRFAEPEEIAEVVYFLGSDKSNYITGEVIKIDGGSNE